MASKAKEELGCALYALALFFGYPVLYVGFFLTLASLYELFFKAGTVGAVVVWGAVFLVGGVMYRLVTGEWPWGREKSPFRVNAG